MYGMYVHIKAVPYVTYKQINKISYQSWSGRSTRRNVKHTYILAVCPYIVCDVLPCQLNMGLDQACWKRQKEAFVTMWKRFTKTQGLWTNKWCYNALCIDILMIYGIFNLHNHMNFVRYLDVFYNPHWCFISINSVDIRYLNSLKKTFSNQWLYLLVNLYSIC